MWWLVPSDCLMLLAVGQVNEAPEAIVLIPCIEVSHKVSSVKCQMRVSDGEWSSCHCRATAVSGDAKQAWCHPWRTDVSAM
jgi:hypothetical protein